MKISENLLMEVRLLGKIKLYELAKDLKMSSKDLLNAAKSLGLKK